MNEVRAADALVGAWRLVSWQNQAADGQVTYPMGTDAMGYLLYGADGRFSVTISRKGRARFAASDLLLWLVKQ
jgi:Lipocalin-like domain